MHPSEIYALAVRFIKKKLLSILYKQIYTVTHRNILPF